MGRPGGKVTPGGHGEKDSRAGRGVDVQQKDGLE